MHIPKLTYEDHVRSILWEADGPMAAREIARAVWLRTQYDEDIYGVISRMATLQILRRDWLPDGTPVYHLRGA